MITLPKFAKEVGLSKQRIQQLIANNAVNNKFTERFGDNWVLHITKDNKYQKYLFERKIDSVIDKLV